MCLRFWFISFIIFAPSKRFRLFHAIVLALLSKYDNPMEEFSVENWKASEKKDAEQKYCTHNLSQREWQSFTFSHNWFVPWSMGRGVSMPWLMFLWCSVGRSPSHPCNRPAFMQWKSGSTLFSESHSVMWSNPCGNISSGNSLVTILCKSVSQRSTFFKVVTVINNT